MTSRRTKISPKSGRGLGHVTPTIFGSTVGYPSDSLASCSVFFWLGAFHPFHHSYQCDCDLCTGGWESLLWPVVPKVC